MQFWMSLLEPNRVPQRKGPFPYRDCARTLREFMKARPEAHITVVTLGHDGPDFEDGTVMLQMLDGRSMQTAKRHRERVKAAFRAA